MRTQQKPVVIVSAYRKCKPESVNQLNHRDLCNTLHRFKIPYKVVEGCYKGRKEAAVLFTAKKRNVAVLYGRFYNQESILELDNERGASLTDLKTGDSEFLGFFIPVCKASALAEDAWTYDIENNQYYIVSDCRLGGHLQR